MEDFKISPDSDLTDLTITDLTILDLKILAEKTAEAVVEKLKSLSITIALAESCTAGLISGLLANTNGASLVLWGSFVCYKKEAKVKMLDLNEEKLLEHGLVSRETASSMAAGALAKSGADISVSITGYAGQTGDAIASAGTVWIATAVKNGEVKAAEFHFTGSRNAVRLRAAITALETVLQVLDIK